MKRISPHGIISEKFAPKVVSFKPDFKVKIRAQIIYHPVGIPVNPVITQGNVLK